MKGIKNGKINRIYKIRKYKSKMEKNEEWHNTMDTS